MASGTNPWSKKGRDRRKDVPSSSTLGSFLDHQPAINLQSVEDILDQRLRRLQSHGEEDRTSRSSRERRYDFPPSRLGSSVDYRSEISCRSVDGVSTQGVTGERTSTEDTSRSNRWSAFSQDGSQISPSYSTLGSRPSPLNLQSVENMLSHRYGVNIPHSDQPSRSSSRSSVSQEVETMSSSTLGSVSNRRSLINLRSIEDVIRRKFRRFRHKSSSEENVDGGNIAPFSQGSSSQTRSMSLHPSDVTFGTSTEAGLSDFSFNSQVWNAGPEVQGGIHASSNSKPGPSTCSTLPPSGYFATNRPTTVASQSSHAGSSYATSSTSSDVSMETSVSMETEVPMTSLTPSATTLGKLPGWEDDFPDQDLNPEPVHDPAQYKYCYRCDGLGITHSDDTWHWAPSPELPCHFCRRCSTCRGNGVIPITSNICHRCEGKGFFHGTPATHTQTGRLRCILCEDCEACEGKGVMPVGRALCAQCRGRGAVHEGGWAEVPHRARRTQRCFFCTPCDWCSGKGTIQTNYYDTLLSK